eukprot:9319256-Pyramimonas_sp.AAC.1
MFLGAGRNRRQTPGKAHNMFAVNALGAMGEAEDVQDAAMHYLEACFVNVVILQPNYRTTGQPS